MRRILLLAILAGLGSCQSGPDPTVRFREAMRAELRTDAYHFQPLGQKFSPRVEEYVEHWKFRRLEHPWGPGVKAAQRLVAYPLGDLHVQVFVPPGPPRGTLFVLHGYLASLGNFSGVIRVMLEEGWTVTAMDLPGHGLSSGTRADIEDFSHYGDAVEAWLGSLESYHGRTPRPWVALGHSTGASSLIEHSRRGRPPWDLLIFSAPLVRHAFWELGQTLALINSWWLWSIRPLVSPDELVGIHSVPTRWVIALGRWTHSLHLTPNHELPVVFHQDLTDNVVDWRFNLPILATGYPNHRTVWVSGMGHVTLSDFERYREAFQPLLDIILETTGKPRREY